MEGRILTHLPVEDIHDYLHGRSEPARQTYVENHCRSCSECLEIANGLGVTIARAQLAPPVYAEPVALRPMEILSPSRWMPQWSWQMSQGAGWVLKTAAASLVLLAVPDSTKFVQSNHFFNVPLQPAVMQLSSTRTLPQELLALTAPKVRMMEARVSQRNVSPKPVKIFQQPVLVNNVAMTEVALLDPPRLDIASTSEPIPFEMETPVVEAYRAKPNLMKRLLSAVASPFRSPRS